MKIGRDVYKLADILVLLLSGVVHTFTFTPQLQATDHNCKWVRWKTQPQPWTLTTASTIIQQYREQSDSDKPHEWDQTDHDNNRSTTMTETWPTTIIMNQPRSTTICPTPGDSNVMRMYKMLAFHMTRAPILINKWCHTNHYLIFIVCWVAISLHALLDWFITLNIKCE